MGHSLTEDIVFNISDIGHFLKEGFVFDMSETGRTLKAGIVFNTLDISYFLIELHSFKVSFYYYVYCF